MVVSGGVRKIREKKRETKKKNIEINRRACVKETVRRIDRQANNRHGWMNEIDGRSERFRSRK